MLVLMASLLDPRTKGGVGIPNFDKEMVYGKVKEAMIFISRELNNNNNVQVEMEFAHEQPMPAAAARQPNDMDFMFEELNDFYMEQQQGQIPAEAEEDQELPGGDVREQHWINAVSTELLMYKQEPPIQLYKATTLLSAAH
jgi:hypothetical protein